MFFLIKLFLHDNETNVTTSYLSHKIIQTVGTTTKIGLIPPVTYSASAGTPWATRSKRGGHDLAWVAQASESDMILS